MSDQHIVNAELREDVGKGASRRLRREGKVPAIIYGGHRDAVSLTLKLDPLLHTSENESFYSSVIEIKVGDDISQQAVVRDMHRHPYKPVIMHVDFMRVSEDEFLTIAVPIHFIGEDTSPAGKTSGVVIQHHLTDVEIQALPKDLPEFLTVDLSDMDVGDSVMLTSIVLPEGVLIPALETNEDYDTTVANAIHVKESQGTDDDVEEILVDEDGEPIVAPDDEEADSDDGTGEEDKAE
jgi:large subunit ribosomal protein L25